MTSANFIDFPILKTERLLLREMRDSDAEKLLELRSDQEVNRFIQRVLPKNLDDIFLHLERVRKNMAQNNSVYWIIQKKEETELAGTICLWNFSEDKKTAELGYELLPVYQRQGLMQEAFMAVLNYGFKTILLENIEAFTQYKNEASISLLLKNHFALEPERRDEDVPDNRIYTIDTTTFNQYFNS